jgi:uncharacterized repeat protein (TIGR01451 family)
MQSFKQHSRRVALAVVALAFGGLAPSAFAAGTDTNFNTDISNQASVNYSVSGVAQTAILSSPTGTGPALATTFKVDKKLMFITEETNATATTTGPGVNGVVTVFRVTNNTNGPEDFQLNACNNGDAACPLPIPQSAPSIFGKTDTINMNGLRARVSGAACSTSSMTTPAYAGETQAFINQLGEDACVYVFVLADTPTTAGGAVDGSIATVLLAVRPSVAGTSGATPEAPTGAADVAGTVEAVFAESGPTTGTSVGNADKDGISFAYDQYVVGTLSVKKTYAVISDGFTVTAGAAKPIPGAVVEYTITVQNNGLATTGASLTEVIPANTTYVAASTTLNGVAVSDVAGAMPFVGGGAIKSQGQASGVVIPGSTTTEQAIVKFRVTIN